MKSDESPIFSPSYETIDIKVTYWVYIAEQHFCFRSIAFGFLAM